MKKAFILLPLLLTTTLFAGWEGRENTRTILWTGAVLLDSIVNIMAKPDTVIIQQPPANVIYSTTVDGAVYYSEAPQVEVRYEVITLPPEEFYYRFRTFHYIHNGAWSRRQRHLPVIHRPLPPPPPPRREHRGPERRGGPGPAPKRHRGFPRH